MNVSSQLLHQHCRRVLAGGFVHEVTFSGPFAANAKSYCGTFASMTAGLPGIEHLPDPIGISELERLVRSLDTKRDQKVHVRVEGGHLHVEFPDRLVRVQILKSELIKTSIHRDMVQRVMELIEPSWRPFPPILAREVARAVRTIQPDLVLFKLDPEVPTVVVGDHHDRYVVEIEAPPLEAPEQYSVFIDPRHAKVCLDELSEQGGMMSFAGPNGIMGVRVGTVTYAVSSMEMARGEHGHVKTLVQPTTMA